MAKQYIEQRSGATATNSGAPTSNNTKKVTTRKAVLNSGSGPLSDSALAKQGKVVVSGTNKKSGSAKKTSSSGKMMKVAKPRKVGAAVSAPSVTKNINRKIY